MAVSHTIIISNNIIHESQPNNIRAILQTEKVAQFGMRQVKKIQLLGIVYEIKEERTLYLDTSVTCL
jgi:hypothetical protein